MPGGTAEGGQTTELTRLPHPIPSTDGAGALLGLPPGSFRVQALTVVEQVLALMNPRRAATSQRRAATVLDVQTFLLGGKHDAFATWLLADRQRRFKAYDTARQRVLTTSALREAAEDHLAEVALARREAQIYREDTRISDLSLDYDGLPKEPAPPPPETDLDLALRAVWKGDAPLSALLVTKPPLEDETQPTATRARLGRLARPLWETREARRAEKVEMDEIKRVVLNTLQLLDKEMGTMDIAELKRLGMEKGVGFAEMKGISSDDLRLLIRRRVQAEEVHNPPPEQAAQTKLEPRPPSTPHFSRRHPVGEIAVAGSIGRRGEARVAAAAAAEGGGRMAEIQRRFQVASYSAGGQDWGALFRQYDRDNSGELDWEEFRRAVRKDAKIPAAAVSDGELRLLFDRCDEDGGGTIGLEEFTGLLGGPPAPAAAATAADDALHRRPVSAHVERLVTPSPAQRCAHGGTCCTVF